ncbi:hypothetical protein Metbo_0377 [Methanobacterium lacus]|uniref:KEOPS complex Pcc1-like subunit n=1 Tax=Methanobacterium lacus (strain AL-21) TaxID=877455 RepID=F0T907_METLA|nr:KEOPS complex subunit Pcc1 [Methanobacterium lacus]ADZ08629.1 hypothetical protein Metbo_0377 [Methanobacterium lacus]
MKITAKIEFRYINPEYAEAAYESLHPDNVGYIESYVENESMICCIEGDSVGRLLATADDLIFCETMVEKIAELTKKP